MLSSNPAGGLDEEEAGLLIGGEVCMWTEAVDEDNLDSVVWPRAAAVGERLWTDDEYTKNTRNVYERLSRLTRSMKKSGIRSSPIRPTYCDTHPYSC